MKRTLSWLPNSFRDPLAEILAYIVYPEAENLNSDTYLEETFNSTKKLELKPLAPQNQSAPENQNNDSVASTHASLQAVTIAVKENEQKDDELNESNKKTEAKKRKDKILSAVFRYNTLVTFLGLNFSYVVIHLFTLWNWHLLVLSAGALATPWVAIPVVLYVALSLWQTRAVIRKNILYQEKKNEYLQRLKEVFKEFETLEKSSLEDFKKTFTREKFDQLNEKATGFQRLQIILEPIKKFSRPLLIISILFGISVAALGLSAALAFVLIPCIAAGCVFAYFDYQAQKSEAAQEANLKYLQWLTTNAKKYQKQLLINEISKFANGKEFLKTITPTSVLYEPSIIDKSLVSLDNTLTGSGINSGYATLGFITAFGLHAAIMGMHIALDVLLFGIPSFFAALIIVINIQENNNLYACYEKDEEDLNKENAILRERIKLLNNNLNTNNLLTLKRTDSLSGKINNHNTKYLKFGLISLLMCGMMAGLACVALGMTFMPAFFLGATAASMLVVIGVSVIALACVNYFMRDQTDDFKKYLGEEAKWNTKITEAFKKGIRPFFMAGLLGALTFTILPAAMVAAIWPVVLIGLAALTLGVGLAICDYLVRDHKERIETRINSLKEDNIYFLNAELNLLKQYKDKQQSASKINLDQTDNNKKGLDASKNNRANQFISIQPPSPKLGGSPETLVDGEEADRSNTPRSPTPKISITNEQTLLNYYKTRINRQNQQEKTKNNLPSTWLLKTQLRSNESIVISSDHLACTN